MNTATAQQINSTLPYFTGTSQYYLCSTPFGSIVLTDGSRYIRDKGKANWLIEIIISYQKQLAIYQFQNWKLKVKEDKTAVVYATDGNDNLLVSQAVEYTDFPLNSFTIYVANGVAYLPSEH